MNEITSSPSGITRISVNKTESFLKTPIERFKSKINLKPDRKELNDVSVQVDDKGKERPLSFSLFRDDTIINTNLIEHLKLKIDKISEELDLAKPRLFPDPKKPKPVLEKSKLIVVNLTPKPGIETLLADKNLNLPKKTNVLQTQIYHETPHENQKKLFLNSTENQNYSGNILAENNNYVNKKNNSTRAEELKIDDNQTPISTSFKSKANAERSLDLINDLLLKKNDQSKTVDDHNITKIEDINKKPNNNRSKSNINEILKIKSLNYYDDIMTKQTETLNVLKQTEHDDKQVQTTMIEPRHTIETQTDSEPIANEQVVFNKNEYIHEEPNEIERDIFRLNKSNNELIDRLETSTRRLETFYNGRKSWTVVSEINEAERRKQKEERESEQDEPIDTSDKLILVEAETSERRKKKNLSVKIKLPDSVDSNESQSEVSIKKRSAQKCCHLFFLLVLFFVTLGILAYFIIWNFVLEKQTADAVKNL